MPGLKEVRVRIASVNSTKQVTSAMKMVSAAKLRRAQDNILKARPYAQKMIEVMEKVSASISVSDNVYSAERDIQNVMLVAITSNRGLCGGFNANVIRNTLRIARETETGKRVSVLSLGRKALSVFRKTEYHIVGTELAHAIRHLGDFVTFKQSSEIVALIMERFAKKEFDKVQLVYNRFKNAATQILTVEDFLPIQIKKFAGKNTTATDYIFEPTQEEIVSQLIPTSLRLQFFRALLESSAAEHGARMTAMHQATDNADELLKSLRLSYNKARQASITKEILEIVGGAEALKG